MRTYERILCGVDFSKLSDAACEQAVALARKLGASLSFLHVIEYFPEDRSNEIIAPETTDPAEYRETQALRGMAALTRALGCKEASQEVLFSPHAAWHAIIQFAGETNTDVIVIGCHGHHGITTLVGSTANGLVNHAPCDVLAVRPHA